MVESVRTRDILQSSSLMHFNAFSGVRFFLWGVGRQRFQNMQRSTWLCWARNPIEMLAQARAKAGYCNIHLTL